eukprot:6207085-Pleurochrysis_carterae.AAC.1
MPGGSDAQALRRTPNASARPYETARSTSRRQTSATLRAHSCRAGTTASPPLSIAHLEHHWRDACNSRQHADRGRHAHNNLLFYD